MPSTTTPELVSLREIRSDDAPATPARVDREAGIIRGASVAMVGEALGHGLLLDQTTIQQLVELGNARPQGIKARFTHPGMCDDGMGKQVARAKDFRVSANGLHALADLHFLDAATDTPDGNLRAYVMNMAEEVPEDFGLSVVMQLDAVWVMADGSEERAHPFEDPPEGATTDMPFARPLHLYAADVVDEPAANELGLFAESLSRGSFQRAEAAFSAIDQQARRLGWDPIDIARFTQRYLSSRGCAATLSIPDREDTPMPKSAALADDQKPDDQPKPKATPAASDEPEEELMDPEDPDHEDEMGEDGKPKAKATDDEPDEELMDPEDPEHEDEMDEDGKPKAKPDQASASVPATLSQLKDACQGADSDFLLAQLEAGATQSQAAAAWAAAAPLRAQLAQRDRELEELRAKQAQVGSWSAAALASPDPGSDDTAAAALEGRGGEVTDQQLEAEWSSLTKAQQAAHCSFRSYAWRRRNGEIAAGTLP